MGNWGRRQQRCVCFVLLRRLGLSFQGVWCYIWHTHGHYCRCYIQRPTTTAAFEIAAEFARYCFSAWSNINGTWNSLNMVANATIGGAYDLMNATSLANWSPMLLVGSDTGDSEAASITMNEFRMTYTQGNGSSASRHSSIFSTAVSTSRTV